MAWMNSLQDPNTRDILRMLGAAVAALVVGGWVVYTGLHPQEPQAVAPVVAAPAYAPAPPPSVIIQAPEAGNGGVAVVIQGNGNQVNTGK